MPGMTSAPRKGSRDFEPRKLSQQIWRGLQKNQNASIGVLMGSNSHAPCGLVNCKVAGPQGPSLTNRMSELLTYVSVGGVGGNPGSYPAVDAGWPPLLAFSHARSRATQAER